MVAGNRVAPPERQDGGPSTIVAGSPSISLFLQPAMVGADTALSWRHHVLRRHFQSPPSRQCGRTGGLRISEGFDFFGHHFRELGIVLCPSSRNLGRRKVTTLWTSKPNFIASSHGFQRSIFDPACPWAAECSAPVLHSTRTLLAEDRVRKERHSGGRTRGTGHADNRRQEPRGEAKSRRAFLQEDHLPDSALVRSSVVEVRTLGPPGDHA
jgi:hypothetical protein